MVTTAGALLRWADKHVTTDPSHGVEVLKVPEASHWAENLEGTKLKEVRRDSGALCHYQNYYRYCHLDHYYHYYYYYYYYYYTPSPPITTLTSPGCIVLALIMIIIGEV